MLSTSFLQQPLNSWCAAEIISVMHREDKKYFLFLQWQKNVNETEIPFIPGSQSDFKLLYTAVWSGKVPRSKSGSGNCVLLSFQVSKGLPLLLLSVEKVQLWCCSAWPSPTDPSSYHPSLYERKEVAHAAVVLVLQQAKMSGWKKLITSWYPYWVLS